MTDQVSRRGTPSLRDRLDAVASAHDQSRGFTPRLIACRAHLLEQLLPPGEVLDLGCADGLLTQRLARRHRRVVGVDASPLRLQRTRLRCAAFPTGRVELREALFEDFEPSAGERFDAVVLSCVLEHLAHPSALLARAATWLRTGGRVVAIVPNAGSLHRRAGVLMGLLSSAGDLDASDEALDHERVYTPESLRAVVHEAGLRVTLTGGYLLKPLPNEHMARLPEDLVDAYVELGRSFPELAAEIYAVGEPPAGSGA